MSKSNELSAYRVSFCSSSDSSSVVRATTVSIDSDQPSTSTSNTTFKQKTPQIKRILEEKPSKQSKTNTQQVCRVCLTKEEVGIHNGTTLCVPCDAFFRKCLNDPFGFYVRPCITGQQTCPVTSKACSFCRAKRCLAVGLNRNKMSEKGIRLRKDYSDILLKPQEIGKIDCNELVRLLKKAAAWGKPNKETQKRIEKNTKEAIRRGLSKKWYAARYPGIHYDYPETVEDIIQKKKSKKDDEPPILPPSKKMKEAKKKQQSAPFVPILPKSGDAQPQVVVIHVPTNAATPSPAQINAIVSSLTSAGVVGGSQATGTSQQITIAVRQPDLTAQQVGAFLAESFSNVVGRVRRIRFEQETPLGEFVDTNSSKAKRLLYNTSERPVMEHWRRIEAHINDILCALVKFAKLLPDFDNLAGDDQHALLTGTLLEMFFIASVFFIDEQQKRLYLNSGCVYSLSYLAYVFSGCSGAGDFFRSLFDFCHNMQAFVSIQDDETKISHDRLGLVLGLTLFSLPPALKINAEESQKQMLELLKLELGDEKKLSSLLECLSSLGSLISKHKRMVTSIRDDALISLAIDLHSELLQLPSKHVTMVK